MVIGPIGYLYEFDTLYPVLTFYYILITILRLYPFLFSYPFLRISHYPFHISVASRDSSRSVAVKSQL